MKGNSVDCDKTPVEDVLGIVLARDRWHTTIPLQGVANECNE